MLRRSATMLLVLAAGCGPELHAVDGVDGSGDTGDTSDDAPVEVPTCQQVWAHSVEIDGGLATVVDFDVDAAGNTVALLSAIAEQQHALASWDADGHLRWQIALEQWPTQVRVDAGGRVFVLGQGGAQAWLRGFTSEGAAIWLEQLGDPSDEWARGQTLSIAADGDLLVGMASMGSSLGWPQQMLWISRHAGDDGHQRWARVDQLPDDDEPEWDHTLMVEQVRAIVELDNGDLFALGRAEAWGCLWSCPNNFEMTLAATGERLGLRTRSTEVGCVERGVAGDDAVYRSGCYGQARGQLDREPRDGAPGWSLSASDWLGDELDDASVDASAIAIGVVVGRDPSGLLVAGRTQGSTWPGQSPESWWLAAATSTGAVEWRCQSEAAPETQHLSVSSRPAPGGAIVVITDKAAVGVIDTLARVEVGD